MAQDPNREELAARALALEGLVHYQAGSVVSRAIMSSAAGTVTLFAFDEGEALSEHTSPYDALVQMLEGEAEVTISGVALRLTKGDMVIMPAREPHALRAATRFKMLLTMIRSHQAAEKKD